MNEMLRKTGIDIIGYAPWSTHFCQFYQTKKDLTDILVPYFKAGLENNEFCMWVTAEPLAAEGARKAIAKAMRGFNKYLEKGQIEIIPHTEWYLKGGFFDSQRVLNGWVDKLNSALAKGFDGLRLTGNTPWLEKKDWKTFAEYEAEITSVIGNYKILALCTYSLDKCNALEIMDVIRNHEFALVKQAGKWNMIENSAYKIAKEALIESEEKFKSLYSSMSEGVALHEIIYNEQNKPVDYVITDVNPAFESITGLKKQETIGQKASVLYKAGEPPYLETYAGVAETRLPTSFEVYFPPMEKYFSISVFSPEKGKFATVFSDITERKAAERNQKRLLEESQEQVAKLEEQQTELELLNEELLTAQETLLEAKDHVEEIAKEWQMTFDSIQDMISIQDKDFRLIRVNKAYEDAVKKHHENLVGKKCFEIIHGVSCALDSCPHKETLATGKSSREEIFEPRLGVFLEISTSPIISDNGEIKGSIHIAKNISERRKAEQALQESRQDLNHAQAVAHLGSWRLDIRCNELVWSDETHRIFGIPCGTPMNYEMFLSVIHPEDRQYVEQRWAEALKGKPYDIEHRILVGSETKWVREKAELEFDDHGQLKGGFGTVQDITQRKLMENSLLFEKDKLKGILDSMEDGVYISNNEYKIEYINPAMQKKFGTLNSQKCYQYLHARSDVCPWCMNDAVFAGKTVHQELAFSKVNAVFELTSTPLVKPDGSLSKLEILHDTTERKNSEDKITLLNLALLRRTAELEAANKELEAFSYSVSHDLRAPLRSINGFSQAVLEDFTDKLDETGKDYLQRIRKASQLMSQLIDDMLRLSRATMSEMHYDQLNLSEMVQQIAEKLNDSQPGRRTKWVVRPGVQVHADRALLKQAIENLVDNAFKFTSKRPDATIEFGVTNSGDNDIYYIKDNGAGFDASYSHKLFRPFQRLHSIADYPGTGIGLALVQRIIKRHGGKVWAEGETGKGATFFFTLH